MSLTLALYAQLTAAPGLVAKIASYGGAPAVFTSRPVPQDAVRPYITLDPDDAQPLETLAFGEGERVERVVYAFADNTGSAVAIEGIEASIVAAFDGARLAADESVYPLCRVVRRFDAPTDATLTGRAVRVQVLRTPA